MKIRNIGLYENLIILLIFLSIIVPITKFYINRFEITYKVNNFMDYHIKYYHKFDISYLKKNFKESKIIDRSENESYILRLNPRGRKDFQLEIDYLKNNKKIYMFYYNSDNKHYYRCYINSSQCDLLNVYK